jgi:hypothetical protein
MAILESKTELFTMSVKELSRLDYIRMFFEKRLNQAEVSEETRHFNKASTKAYKKL